MLGPVEYNHTRADKVPAPAISEIMENSVAVGLEHLGMDVEAGVSYPGTCSEKYVHKIHKQLYVKPKLKTVVR